jgi:hypothetical protein
VPVAQSDAGTGSSSVLCGQLKARGKGRLLLPVDLCNKPSRGQITGTERAATGWGGPGRGARVPDERHTLNNWTMPQAQLPLHDLLRKMCDATPPIAFI